MAIAIYQANGKDFTLNEAWDDRDSTKSGSMRFPMVIYEAIYYDIWPDNAHI